MNHSIRISLIALTLACGCSNPPTYSSTLNIAFSPMYSGYDGVHAYQIPATVNNGMSVTWTASDSSFVDLVPDPNGTDVMITTKKAGKVTIIATAGDAQGKATLTIEAFTPDQWTAGMARYTSGSMVTLGGGTHGGPKDAACTSCHDGTTAIEHTPEQTGGYTDDEIKNIFMKGLLPAVDQSNTLFVSPQFFMGFHTWTIASDQEAAGVLAYLRALKPKAQGQLNFGGRPDGGMRPDGGGMRPDGGYQGPPDAAVPATDM